MASPFLKTSNSPTTTPSKIRAVTTPGSSRRARRTAPPGERYQTDRDLHALIAAVAGTYATDPNYARLCSTIAGQANVAQAITGAQIVSSRP